MTVLGLSSPTLDSFCLPHEAVAVTAAIYGIMLLFGTPSWSSDIRERRE